MDDENPTEVTAGAIVTVIVTLVRKNMSILFDDETVKENTITEYEVDPDNNTEGTGDAELQNPVSAEKRPVWMKPKIKGKKSKKPTNKRKPVSATKQKVEESSNPSSEQQKRKEETDKEEDSEESDKSDDETNDKSSEEDGVQKSNKEDDDQEWEKFKIHKREKVLQGKSKISHSVHCPYFPEDKQEYWWIYICDRKLKTLVTAPQFVTSLVDKEVVHLKFPALMDPGQYTLTVCLKSDSYIGFDQQKDIKLDVKQAPPEITEHPQWEELEEDEGSAQEEANESEYTTDEDLPEDDV